MHTQRAINSIMGRIGSLVETSEGALFGLCETDEGSLVLAFPSDERRLYPDLDEAILAASGTGKSIQIDGFRCDRTRKTEMPATFGTVALSYFVVTRDSISLEGLGEMNAHYTAHVQTLESVWRASRRMMATTPLGADAA